MYNMEMSLANIVALNLVKEEEARIVNCGIWANGGLSAVDARGP